MNAFSFTPAGVRRAIIGLACALGAGWCLAVTVPGALAQSAVTTQSLPYGPVHRYTFGSSAAGTANSGDVLLDSVGVAHGVLRGSGASYTGSALRLNGGASTTAAYIDLPNGIVSGSATSYPGYSSATYELWVTVYGNLNWSRLFDFGSGTVGEVSAPGGTQTGTDYLMLTANVGTDPTVQFERSNGMPGGGKATLANGNSFGTEMHVVVVYDNTTGLWKWYKNGALQGQISSLLGPSTILDQNNWLGRSNFAADSNTNAAYREFRIYDYALTDAQIAGNYQAGANALTSPVGNVGPFAWYKLAGTLGTTLAADASGGGNPGTLSGGALYQPGGITGPTAVSINGGYVQVPNSVALVNPTDAMTVAAWIKPSDLSGTRRIMQKGATNNQYRLTVEGGVLKFELANPVRTVTAALPATGVWSHVAGTYDGAALRLFVNGVQVAAVNASGSIPTSSDDFFVGAASTTSTTDRFAGLVDDLRLYSRALTATEINALATAVTMAAPAATATIQEAAGIPGVITVTRTGDLSAPLTVALSQPPPASGSQAAVNVRFIFTPASLNLTIPAGQASASVTVTPLSDRTLRGTEVVTLVAAPASSYFLTGDGTATIQLLDTPLNVWKISKFGGLTNAQSQGGDTVDPDGDGLTNLLEYALNADPLKADNGGLTVAGLDGGKLTFTYNRLKKAPELSYHVQWSSGLTFWSEPTPTETILSDDGTVQRVKATFPGDSSGSGFARLQVIRN